MGIKARGKRSKSHFTTIPQLGVEVMSHLCLSRIAFGFSAVELPRVQSI